jgi:hypothetical protein
VGLNRQTTQRNKNKRIHYDARGQNAKMIAVRCKRAVCQHGKEHRVKKDAAPQEEGASSEGERLTSRLNMQAGLSICRSSAANSAAEQQMVSRQTFMVVSRTNVTKPEMRATLLN